MKIYFNYRVPMARDEGDITKCGHCGKDIWYEDNYCISSFTNCASYEEELLKSMQIDYPFIVSLYDMETIKNNKLKNYK